MSKFSYMKCPNCNKTMILKKSEAYKDFYLCADPECWVVSMILTTTEKGSV